MTARPLFEAGALVSLDPPLAAGQTDTLTVTWEGRPPRHGEMYVGLMFRHHNAGTLDDPDRHGGDGDPAVVEEGDRRRVDVLVGRRVEVGAVGEGEVQPTLGRSRRIEPHARLVAAGAVVGENQGVAVAGESAGAESGDGAEVDGLVRIERQNDQGQAGAERGAGQDERIGGHPGIVGEPDRRRGGLVIEDEVSRCGLLPGTDAGGVAHEVADLDGLLAAERATKVECSVRHPAPESSVRVNGITREK